MVADDLPASAQVQASPLAGETHAQTGPPAKSKTSYPGRPKSNSNERSGGNKRKRGQAPGGRAKREVNDSYRGLATWDRKRRRVDDPGAADWGREKNITAEEIDGEERRPKRKVAVMIGYAGTGYKGMQINKTEKTIEGDLFAAFIAANAISKANADDPRKSAFVRCARTDKGVHAAGNVVSLKLIIEDPEVVNKINENLPPQIRVWGIQRTNKSFSCYKTCDSRWYEYLMPSYCLIPPHPDSFIGKKLVESARKEGVYDDYVAGNEDLKDFWAEVDSKHVKPILAELDKKTRETVMARLNAPVDFLDGVVPKNKTPTPEPEPKTAETGKEDIKGDDVSNKPKLTSADYAFKDIKNAIVAAKRTYRVSPGRVERLQAALNKYVGTKNFYNYTVAKTFKDKSAQRHIKSFVVNPNPIQINDTQWLSLKVHGQSFMMHQIRKMVAMAVLCTRYNTPLDRVDQSYEDNKISIPKAPGVGLLLERPVFDHHNERMSGGGTERQPINFSKWDTNIEEFKQNHIYQRIWDVEEAEAPFHTFFNQIDNFDTDYFLWVTATGIPAAHIRVGPGDADPMLSIEDQSDEDEIGDNQDSEGADG